MELNKILEATLLICIISSININNLYAKSNAAANLENIKISYNFSYNLNMDNNLNYNFYRYNATGTDSNFAKDKLGKLISFNDEKIQNEKILDLVGMFTSRYDSKKNLRLKIRLDNNYKLRKALVNYKIIY
ncbi:MAG: hypothetical protein HON23_05560 [Rickettsiales bacterium]|nr:hypothetical protein [Rickettsiales bacterium]